MDYNKIGKFIATERKAQKLTQAKLAEKLFISEKTISKWENGNGIPDTNSLPKLCKIFNVSLNELLNGERMSGENYVDKAEQNLLKLQQEKEQSDKRLLAGEIVLGTITTISFIIILLTAIYAINLLNMLVIPIIMIAVGTIIFFGGVAFCLYIEQKAGFYVCAKCNHRHIPSLKQVFFAMHMGRTRYIKCPNCNKRSWQKKITH